MLHGRLRLAVSIRRLRDRSAARNPTGHRRGRV